LISRHHGGKEVFLCWEQDEENIEFWHDLDTGFGAASGCNAWERRRPAATPKNYAPPDGGWKPFNSRFAPGRCDGRWRGTSAMNSSPAAPARWLN